MSTAAGHDERVLRAWAAGRLGSLRGGSPEVVFGQVREDAAVEMAALMQTGVKFPVIVAVGSGGCTGFGLLSTAPAGRLTLIDINPAQTHLLRLKAAVIAAGDRADILAAVTEDARPAFATFRGLLPADTGAFWDARTDRLAHGLNRAGLIDRRMATAMRVFHTLFQRPAATAALLDAPTLDAQRDVYRTRWNRGIVRAALRVGLSRLVLRLVYGPEFVRLAPAGLGDIMARRLESVFLDVPARANPYVWQAFAGRYPEDPAGLPPYLQPDALTAIRDGLARAAFVTADMAAHLETQPTGSVHFVALSNILEGLSEGYGRRLFGVLSRALAPGAVAVLRFLLPPPPDWEAWLPASLAVDTELSAEREARDRSLFCRFIRVIRRQER